MATVYQHFSVWEAVPAGTNFPTQDVAAGAAFPVPCLDFDASTEEACYFFFHATQYGSGNLTLDIDWYADSATSGDVIWGAAVAAITPNTDSQDIETKTFASPSTVTDSHLGTTGQRLHRASITLSNLDSLAGDDWVVLKLYRDADAGGDTMAGDACVVGLRLSYADT